MIENEGKKHNSNIQREVKKSEQLLVIESATQ